MFNEDIQIAKSVSIVEIVQLLGIKIYRNKINCPFHNDRNASLEIYPHTNTFYCFGCGKYGDSVSFIMNYYKCSYPQAVNMIKNRLFNHIHMPNNTNNIVHTNKTKYFKDIKLINEIYKYFFNNITLTKNGKDYLINKRFLTLDIINKYKIKSIDNHENIFDKLRCKYSYQQLSNVGLISESKRTGNPYFTFFLPSVIFPHIRNGKYIYAISRSYQDKSYLKPQNIKPRIFTPNIHSISFVIVESIICGLSYELLTGNDNWIALSSINIKLISKILKIFSTRNITLMLDNDNQTPAIYNKLKQQKLKFKTLNPITFAKQFLTNITNPIKDINDILRENSKLTSNS